MNKKELVAQVSEKSGVNINDCEKVLDAFEKVLSGELSNSKDVGGAFDKVYKVLNFFETKRRNS